MSQVLMRAVVDAAVFVGLSGDDVIQPDAAVAYLEQLASTMKDLTGEERDTFARYVANLAKEERAEGRTERADFLARLCDDLGLIE